MDSAYESLILADPLAARRLSPWQRLRRALTLPGARRERLVEMHRGRVLALAVALQVGALTLLAGSVWTGQRTAGKVSAEAAVVFVDERLDEIDAALRAVRDGLAQAVEPDSACADGLTQQLVAASLDSMLLQRVWLVAADGVQACGPQGAVALGDMPPILGAGLALVSLRGAATELLVARRLPDGRVLAAKLDPRAMALPANGPWEVDGGRGRRITLHSSDERALRIWESMAAQGPPMPSLHVHLRSDRYHHAISVEEDRLVFFMRLLSLWPLALGAAALITLLSCLRVWNQAMTRSRLGRRIERALRKRQFEPYVQPIVDMASGRCVGGEVLMRWAHPERGVLPPSEFIDEAERTGLIVAMSSLVMGRAAHRLAPLAQANPELYFSFNITAGQLRRPNFAAELADIFSADTLPPAQVLLELTEREALDPLTQRTVRALHAAGWRIAIDDFGTGQSSLAALEQMPIDRLKIDRAFVSAVGEQTARRPVLDAIIGLARDLGLQLVAEGVETQAQWDYLAQRQVGSAQGYLIARPMALDAFGNWFEAQLAPCIPAPDLSSSQAAAAAVSGTVQCPAALMHNERLVEIWRAMFSAGGVGVSDRLFQLRLYRRCIVGREMVDWLVRHAAVSRVQALRIGRRLVALGCMKHVLDEHDFKDGDYFYVAVPDAAHTTLQPLPAGLREALHGVGGPVQADHSRGLLRLRRSLCGTDLVNWLCAHYPVTRATALLWAAQLMRQGQLRHVFDDRPVSDSQTLYRLT